MSAYTKVAKYIADTFRIKLVLQQPTSGDAQMKFRNFLRANMLRQDFCGGNVDEKEFKKAFFTRTDDPDYGTKYQKKKWPIIIFARDPQDEKKDYGFIVYHESLTMEDTKRLQAAITESGSEWNLLQANPAKIVALCTVGGNKCVGQSLLAAALAEQEKRGAWVVDIPAGLTSNNGQLVTRFFNQYLFSTVGSKDINGRTYLVAINENFSAEMLIDLLRNCHTKHPQLSAQAAVEAKQAIDVVVDAHPEQPQEVVVSVVLNAMLPGAVAPPGAIPADVKVDAIAAAADAADELKSVALDADPNLSESSAQAQAAEALQEAAAEVVAEGSRYSTKQKLVMFGVFSGGLIGLAGILNLAAKKKRRW